MKTFNNTIFALGSSGAVGKYYLITWEVKNDCSGTSSMQKGLVHINSAPSNPSGVLKFNGGYAWQSNQSVSHSISSPNTGGCYSSSFNLTSTTGTMFLYKVDIDQVDCTTGSYIQTIVHPSSYSLISGDFYTGIGINSAPGVSGYFGANNGSASLNNCYKMTVYYGNQCDIPSEWTYFKIDNTAHKTDETTGISENITTAGALVIHIAPNPAQNQLNLMIENQDEQEMGIKLYDITGRLVKTVTNGQPLISGENYMQIDISDLISGIYFVHLTSSNGYQSSMKFIKQ
jgi:hypothetical protein